MLRLDLQFYAFFVTVLCGAVLGLLYDVLRVVRTHYRPNMVAGSATDLLFWAVATGALSGGLFFANWAELRFYVAVGIGLGVVLYLWLASPVIRFTIRLIIHALEWIVSTAVMLFMKLVWAPARAIALFLWSALQIIAGWLLAVGTFLWRLWVRLAWILWRPLIGPYRCFRLQYLLLKRRLRRRFRR